MSGGSTPPRALSPLRLFSTFCVLAPTVGVIAVPAYDSATPKLGGFPFFYWYQLMWVALTGVLMVAAYFAIRTDERRRKAFHAAAAAGAAPIAGPAGGTGPGDGEAGR
jgi:hypothetical protein